MTGSQQKIITSISVTLHSAAVTSALFPLFPLFNLVCLFKIFINMFLFTQEWNFWFCT